ncbi:MAG: hypothetical protein HYY24_24395 [Verrucomicrobia bacterium]|nr:hypothetical protein [Verrucomicrobiota bacterium]
MSSFRLLSCLALFCAAAWLRAGDPEWRTTERSAAPRFAVFDVFIDSGDRPLAAWQLYLRATRGRVKLVGVEGGGHAAFRKPPHYDPKALQGDRIRLAAFSTNVPASLPAGEQRVASLHVQITARTELVWTNKVEAAADAAGKSIPIAVTIKERPPK